MSAHPIVGAANYLPLHRQHLFPSRLCEQIGNHLLKPGNRRARPGAGSTEPPALHPSKTSQPEEGDFANEKPAAPMPLGCNVKLNVGLMPSLYAARVDSSPDLRPRTIHYLKAYADQLRLNPLADGERIAAIEKMVADLQAELDVEWELMEQKRAPQSNE